MEESKLSYLKYGIAFALGIAAYKLGSYFFEKKAVEHHEDIKKEPVRREETKEESIENDSKKVRFASNITMQEELKELILKTVKETIGVIKKDDDIGSNRKGSVRIHNEPKSRRRFSEVEEPIYKIWFTGGPCAGKTTALTLLNTEISMHGFRVLIVPEAASLLMKAGYLIDNSKFTDMEAIQFQSSLMRLQIFLEDITLEYAAMTSNKPVVIFWDRGLMDGKAYVSQNVWQAILDEMGWNEVYLRDSRYDAVIHMVTAAIGAEKYYDLDTNEARYETLEVAQKVDRTLQKNWGGHSQMILIDNNAVSFEEKINKVLKTVLNLLGIPQTTIFNWKYLIYPFLEESIDVPFEVFHVEEVYLKCPANQQAKLIRKGTVMSFNYVIETKKSINDQVITRRRQITSREYLQYKLEREDLTKINLQKKRISFLFENQHFIIDTFVNIKGKPSLLRVETEIKSENVVKPAFLKYFRDVTDENEYSTINMADKDYKVPERDRDVLIDFADKQEVHQEKEKLEENSNKNEAVSEAKN